MMGPGSVKLRRMAPAARANGRLSKISRPCYLSRRCPGTAQ